MSRIEVEHAELELAARRLDACTRTAREVHGDARRVAADVADCGHAGLADATHDFLDRWAHGMGALAEDAGALTSLLGQAAAGYRRLDAGIAAAIGGGR